MCGFMTIRSNNSLDRIFKVGSKSTDEINLKKQIKSSYKGRNAVTLLIDEVKEGTVQVILNPKTKELTWYVVKNQSKPLTEEQLPKEDLYNINLNPEQPILQPINFNKKIETNYLDKIWHRLKMIFSPDYRDKFNSKVDKIIQAYSNTINKNIEDQNSKKIQIRTELISNKSPNLNIREILSADQKVVLLGLDKKALDFYSRINQLIPEEKSCPGLAAFIAKKMQNQIEKMTDDNLITLTNGKKFSIIYDPKTDSLSLDGMTFQIKGDKIRYTHRSGKVENLSNKELFQRAGTRWW